MDATTIVLPAAPAEARRPQLPLLAAIVPVIAGVVLWLVTGSLFSLCFAALGPLMLLASFFDGIRTRKKERRRAETESDAAWQRAEAECQRLHLDEHAALWRRHPDVVQCLTEPPLRGHEEPGRSTALVLGRGTTRSVVQANGGDDDRSRAFRARAQSLEDAPVVVELGGGVCVRAPRAIAEAVVRALVVQLCLRFSPAQLGLVGDGVSACGLDGLPHAGRRRAGFRLRIGEGAEAADALIAIRMPGEQPSEGVTTVLDCQVPARAQARTPDGRTLEVVAEALSVQQSRSISVGVAGHADAEEGVPDVLSFDELAPFAPSGRASGLGATFGRGERGDLSVDLVEDGPHAIVTGMTGTGKSELLISWVAGIAASHGPDEVSFVLIDFKGGTAFDPLRTLPHVVAVVTDLDAEGARRGVGSLSAELRRREAALAAAGVRDVRECPTLPRLVVMVDEFAAMLQEHPDLGEVFTDVAARGRALGMHLVLGTQRASGIIRDALAANCPLRLSLRVAETADSRFVIGSDDAAALPGGVESRGLAFVRRPRDTAAHAARIALTTTEDLQSLAGQWPDAAVQASPWLPPLPAEVSVPGDAVREAAGGVAVIGIADEPEQQRQPWVTLRAGDGLAIVGGSGSGKSSAIAMLAAQMPDAVLIPDDAETAWDAVAELATGRHGMVLCDDLDVLVGQYPPDHAQQFLSRWEAIARSPEGVVVTVSRVSGMVGKLVESLPRRALLRLSSKIEHITAGGEAGSFQRARADGRAWLEECETQLCAPAEGAAPPSAGGAVEPALWRATRNVTGVVVEAVDAARAVLSATHPQHRLLSLTELDAARPDAAEPAPLIIVGDPEEWRARWTQLQTVRTGGELLVAAECATELRQLAGVRELPPYARLHADRAWAVSPGSRPRRVLIG